MVMLAALHRVDPKNPQNPKNPKNPVAVRLPRCEFGLPWRGDLEAALRELGRPCAAARSPSACALLAGAAGQLRRRLETLDRWASGAAAAGEAVITHGEPHPGNVIRVGRQIMLVDWDTVGLAPPERDLWLVASETGDELRRYTELTGRTVDATALELYRLPSPLTTSPASRGTSAARHRRHRGHLEDAWQSLEGAIAQVTR